MLKLAAKDREQLMQSARDILRRAYAPYSGFKVGAAAGKQNAEPTVGRPDIHERYVTRGSPGMMRPIW